MSDQNEDKTVDLEFYNPDEDIKNGSPLNISCA